MSLYRFPIALFLTVVLVAFSVEARALEVRVGFYDNPPQIFADESGEPQGLYPDLLRAVAAAEGWSLTYVPGTFTEGLERLRRGEIDLMTAIAFREDRTDFADFSRKSVLFLWAELVASPKADISSLIDVHGRRVAVTRSGNNFAVFKDLCRQFGIQPEFLEFDHFQEVFEAVADGRADAGIASKLFAAREREHYGLVPTGVIFNPFTLHFAAPKWQGNGLLDLLDRHLDAWQKDSGSVYYRSLERWLDASSQEPENPLPTWLYPLILGLIVCLMIGVAWVITLRRKVRQATAAIAAREFQAVARKDYLQQIIDSMPIGIWLADANGKVNEGNPAGQKIWGRKGLPVVDDYGVLRGWWADSGQPLGKGDWGLPQVLNHGQAWLEKRLEIETADGQRKIILASALPLLDEQDRLTGVLEIEQDITAHRRAEQAVAALARQWQETFDAVTDGIVVLDRDFRAKLWNQAFEALTRKDASSIEGNYCWQLVHDTDEPGANCLLKRMQASGKSEMTTLQKKNRWWAVRADPLFDDAGNICGAIQVFSDITRSKEFETLLNDERLALEMVATGAPLNEILDKIALNMEAHIQAAICSVLLISDDGTSLRHGSSPGLPLSTVR